MTYPWQYVNLGGLPANHLHPRGATKQDVTLDGTCLSRRRSLDEVGCFSPSQLGGSPGLSVSRSPGQTERKPKLDIGQAGGRWVGMSMSTGGWASEEGERYWQSRGIPHVRAAKD